MQARERTKEKVKREEEGIEGRLEEGREGEGSGGEK